MIQSPQPGEVLVGVPRIGVLLDLHPHLNPVFGGLLLRGKRLPGSADAVEWLLEGHDRASPESAAVADVRAQLERRCEDALAVSAELEQAIRRVSRDAAMVKVSPELLARLGARSGALSLSVGTARALQEALPRAVRAVRRAAQRGEFAVRDGRAKLFGWCFLPGDDLEQETSSPRAFLEHAFEALGTSEACHRFIWTVVGVARSVRLVVGEDAPVTVEGTEQVLRHRDESGVWRMPLDRVQEGDLCRVRVRWSDGEIDSEPVRIPSMPRPASSGASTEFEREPPPAGPKDHEPPRGVSLSLSLEERILPQRDVLSQRLDWIADGPIDSVELIQVDSDLWRVRAGPDEVRVGSRAGSWTFDGGVLEQGTEYKVRALGPSGEALSNKVRIPDRPVTTLRWLDRPSRWIWQRWALWGPCAWCSRMGWTRAVGEPSGCCPPGCLPVGCTARGCLSGLFGLLLLLLLAWLLRNCAGSDLIARIGEVPSPDGPTLAPDESAPPPEPLVSPQPRPQPPSVPPARTRPGEFDPGNRWGGA